VTLKFIEYSKRLNESKFMVVIGRVPDVIRGSGIEVMYGGCGGTEQAQDQHLEKDISN
jgi:hypothetical protein